MLITHIKKHIILRNTYKEEFYMKKIITNNAPAAVGPYSQGVVVANILYTSGQIALDPQTNEITGDTIESQAEQVMKNLMAIFSEAGTTQENTIKTTCFLADMNDFEKFNAIYEKFFTEKPARSCVAVRTLPKGVLCEVDAIVAL